MDFAPETLELLRTERARLLADLNAIDSGHEPWIPQSEIKKLRRRVAAVELAIIKHELLRAQARVRRV
jgi:hypothetical protein